MSREIYPKTKKNAVEHYRRRYSFYYCYCYCYCNGKQMTNLLFLIKIYL